MKKILINIFILLLLLSSSSIVFSQVKTDLNNTKSGKLPEIKKLLLKSSLLLPKRLSIFNPERFKMNQSYSMFYSSGRFGGMTGLYTNTIHYKLSDAMKLRFQFGYMLQPSFLNSNRKSFSSINNGIFLPNFDLKYQPSENTIIRFSFKTYTPGLNFTPHYYDYYYDDNFWFW